MATIPKPRKCSHCHKPVSVELHISQVRTGKQIDPPDGRPYGRFSLLIECPRCGLRQKKIVKFSGDESMRLIHQIVEQTWKQLGKKVKPVADHRGKLWGTLCWVRDLEI